MTYDGLIGTTLADALKALPSEMMIKVGTENGSGFFWIGRLENLKKQIDDVSESMRDVLRRAAEKDIGTISRRTPSTYGSWASIQLREFVKDEKSMLVTDMAHYKLYLDEFNAQTHRKAGYAKKKVDMYHSFIPLSVRKVTDVFEADTAVEPEGTISLIIAGDESGRWWYTEEQERDERAGKTAHNFGGVIRTPKQA